MSVRSVAERVGVSTPSIYLHFADKAALLDAVCEAVFADLDRVMQEAAAQSDDPFDGLRLRGVVYARFALENPEQYRLAMMRMPSAAARRTRSAPRTSWPDRPTTTCARPCSAASTSASSPPAPIRRSVSTSLWAAAHGAVSLCLAKPGLAGDDAVALCETIIEHVGLGAALSSHIGGHDLQDVAGAVGVSLQLAGMFRAIAAPPPA